MRAITVRPGVPRSVHLDDVPEPSVEDGPVLVEMLAVGICGTDREIIEGHYGEAPQSAERLVLGHESLARVLQAPSESGLASGDLVVGIVRRPDPVPCPNCAVGEWDMCRNGRYTEHGIKGLHGFMAERVRLGVDEVVKVSRDLGHQGVLLEPASVLAKAWEHLEHIGRRSRWTPRTVLVTGAGPIGLMAAMMAAQRRFEVHVVDRVTTGAKPELVRALGATYHTGDLADAVDAPDVIIECTGVPSVIVAAMKHAGTNGIVCLTGVSSGRRCISIEAAVIGRELVLENNVVFGTVNANRLHYERGAEALATADAAWLSRIITRRVPVTEWEQAFERHPDDVKTVLVFGQ